MAVDWRYVAEDGSWTKVQLPALFPRSLEWD